MKSSDKRKGLVILAGGKNSRMRQNKALLIVNQQKIIERIMSRLGGLFGETIIVTNSPETYANIPDVRIVRDVFPNKGPLGGIHAGLTYASYDKNLFVACDMPFVSGEVARQLFDNSAGSDVTVPVIDGKYQPLFAVYSKGCIPVIEEQLREGKYKITDFYEKVRVAEVDLHRLDNYDFRREIFYNVNTPAELEEARRMAEQKEILEENGVKKKVRAQQWKKGHCEDIIDLLVVEKPLTIHLNEQEIVTLLCSAEQMDELAVGFLISEGLLRSKADEIKLKIDRDEGMVWVTAPNTSLIAEQTFLKRYITTGCGKGTTFYNVLDAQCPPVESDVVVEAERISYFMTKSQQISRLFKETGGVHLAALCAPKELLLFREDIGRHNALDKIVGRCFMEGISVRDKMIFTTGRLSSEIILKVAKLGVPILVSRSAPTSLAVELARQLGVTLIGFARGGRISVYSNEHRIAGGVEK